MKFGTIALLFSIQCLFLVRAEEGLQQDAAYADLSTPGSGSLTDKEQKMIVFKIIRRAARLNGKNVKKKRFQLLKKKVRRLESKASISAKKWKHLNKRFRRTFGMDIAESMDVVEQDQAAVEGQFLLCSLPCFVCFS
jgi:hypothetical protein